MLRNVFVFLLLGLLLSCSVQKKLTRKYEGEGRELLLSNFGEPSKIVDLGNGFQRFIYVKEKYIHETEFSTGRTTLDPRISPGYIKEETYRFDVNLQGIVVSSSYEKRLK